MKGNDLANSITPRYYVMAEVVFRRVEKAEQPRKGWLRTMFTKRIYFLPDLTVLSRLWRWSAQAGVRLELVFAGDLVPEAPELWRLLDEGSANPFSDYQLFETVDSISAHLAYRPDLLGVIDAPDRAVAFGGRGLTLEMLP